MVELHQKYRGAPPKSLWSSTKNIMELYQKVCGAPPKILWISTIIMTSSANILWSSTKMLAPPKPSSTKLTSSAYILYSQAINAKVKY